MQQCKTNLLTRIELKMCHTQRNDLEVLSAKLGRHGKFLPAPPFSTFTVLCQHWWMVRNLESKLISHCVLPQNSHIYTHFIRDFGGIMAAADYIITYLKGLNKTIITCTETSGL